MKDEVKREGVARKAVDVLIFRSAFNQRNITSLALVLLFFLVYILAGGKIGPLPNVRSAKTFGGAPSNTQAPKGAPGDVDQSAGAARATAKPRVFVNGEGPAGRAESQREDPLAALNRRLSKKRSAEAEE